MNNTQDAARSQVVAEATETVHRLGKKREEEARAQLQEQWQRHASGGMAHLDEWLGEYGLTRENLDPENLISHLNKMDSGQIRKMTTDLASAEKPLRGNANDCLQVYVSQILTEISRRQRQEESEKRLADLVPGGPGSQPA